RMCWPTLSSCGWTSRHNRHKPIPFLKTPPPPIRIPALLIERSRIPLTARRGEEVAAINVNGPGQPWDRICHRVNDVPSQRLGVSQTKSLCTGGFKLGVTARYAAPENIVLASRVNSDHCPHVVIVRHQCHVRRPYNVQNGQLIRAINRLDRAASWFS